MSEDDGFNFGDFQPVSERIKHERADRRDKCKRVLPFGISYLDEATYGILPNDVCLVGAYSGAGKSWFALRLALYNAKRGKRIHFFALEADKFEIEQRIRYALVSDYFFKHLSSFPKGIDLNFGDWYFERYQGHLKAAERAAVEEMEKLQTFFTFYRDSGSFGVKDFARLMLSAQDETDLIILDHIHYLDSDEINENQALKEQIKAIRDLALISNKPVILVAHLRKAPFKNKQLVADLDEFHGSSNLTRIATKVITINRGGSVSSDPSRISSFIYVPKCRMNGNAALYAGNVIFNMKTQQYEESYLVGALDKSLEKFTQVTDPKQRPYWAKSAVMDITSGEMKWNE